MNENDVPKIVLQTISILMEAFEFERQIFVKERKKKLLVQNREYLQRHPELTTLIQDFLNDALCKTPDDVFGFAQAYFSRFSHHFVPVYSTLPLFVFVCGPCCGRSSLISLIMGKYATTFDVVNGITTNSHSRKKENEKVSQKAFDELKKSHKLLVNTEKRGHSYGIEYSRINHIIDRRKIPLLTVDVEGAKLIKTAGKKCLVICIIPPSLQELEERLHRRVESEIEKGQTEVDTDDIIQNKLIEAKELISLSNTPGTFDRIIVNDKLDETFEQFEALASPFIRQQKQLSLNE